MALNICCYSGRISQEPELRFTPSGIAYLPISVAVDVGFGEKKKTFFIRGTAWRKVAEGLASFIKKGMFIEVEGELITSERVVNEKKWTDLGVSIRKATIINTGESLDGESDDLFPPDDDAPV